MEKTLYDHSNAIAANAIERDIFSAQVPAPPERFVQYPLAWLFVAATSSVADSRITVMANQRTLLHRVLIPLSVAGGRYPIMDRTVQDLLTRAGPLLLRGGEQLIVDIESITAGNVFTLLKYVPAQRRR